MEKLLSQKQLKIILVLILISFFGIYFYESNSKLEVQRIEDISFSNLNEVISFKAKVSKINYCEKVSFLEFEDKKSKISGIIFENINIDEFLFKEVEVIGKVNFNNEKIGIVIYEIKII